MDKKIIFLIDFDITISKNDSTDVLLEVHNPDLKKEIRKKYRNNEITMLEYLKTGIESLNIDRQEFIETLKNVKIDESFKNFVDKKIPFKIVSAGTRLNISGTLSHYGINLTNEDIISNDISFNGDKITVTNPFLDKERYYGVDKKEAVNNYKQQGYTVYFVGDGPSDYRAIEVADFSFIRKGTRAVKFCEENNINFKQFENFNELIEFYENK